METQMVLCREPVGQLPNDYSRPEWNKKPVDESQIPELLERIVILRQNMLTGEAVVFDWMKRRIQPLQAQETLGFQYQGAADSSRYSKEEISDDEAFSRVRRLLRDVKKIPVVPDTYSAASPPKQVLNKSSRYVVIEYFTLV